jgi:hypothetical protein
MYATVRNTCSQAASVFATAAYFHKGEQYGQNMATMTVAPGATWKMHIPAPFEYKDSYMESGKIISVQAFPVRSTP